MIPKLWHKAARGGLESELSYPGWGRGGSGDGAGRGHGLRVTIKHPASLCHMSTDTLHMTRHPQLMSGSHSPPFLCLTQCHCTLHSGRAWSRRRCLTRHSRGCTRRLTSASPWRPGPGSPVSRLRRSPHRFGAESAAAGQSASAASESWQNIWKVKTFMISLTLPLTYLTVSTRASACAAPGRRRCICRVWRQLGRGLCRTPRRRCYNTSAALTRSPWGRAWCRGDPRTASGTRCTVTPVPPRKVGTCDGKTSTLCT